MVPDTFDLDYAGPFLVVVAAVSVLLLLAWAVSRFLAVGAREQPEQPEPTIDARDLCMRLDCTRRATSSRHGWAECAEHASERAPFDQEAS